jgi:putative nucleotidyltransferase with HDIG domain
MVGTAHPTLNFAGARMSEQIQAKRVELILQQLDQLPTLPAVALRVLEVTGDSDASLADVARAIAADPALTARLLQLVHRAELGIGQEVTSVDRAVVLLGFDAVRSAVLASSVFETFGSSRAEKGAPGPFSREEFWKHSIAVACAAELLAEAMVRELGEKAGVKSDEAFVCGLLHDVGKAALDAVLPKSFAKVIEATDLLRANIADLERNVIGLDHMIVGKRLAERWRLPSKLSEAIWLHGQSPRALPDGIANAKLVNLVTLADFVAREQHLGYSGNYVLDSSRDELIEAIGLTAQKVETALAPLAERIEKRAAMMNLYVPSTGDLYRQAMKRANIELGRVSTQLAMKNRRLALRSRFFDLLSAFQGELRHEAGAGMVLEAVARSAVTVLDRPVAAFSFAAGRDFAETILLNDKGIPYETTLVDFPGAAAANLPPSPSAEGPVLPAGDELDWLLEAIGPRLAGERRFWICLSADGHWIGGIIWGADAGEAQRLSLQAQELTGLAAAWQWALRTAQIREESRRLSEQLAQSNRELAANHAEVERGRLMISIAEMAAGAAHEMNNPLAVIAGRAQLLASELLDPRQQNSAKLIHEQSDRLARIISELMDYAQPSPPAIGPCDAAELIDRAMEQAKARSDSADRKIELTIAQVPRLSVDFRQVAAALAEVVDNALLATEESNGHVEIHTAYDPLSKRVAITVSDDGAGMDEYTLRRAFDPFFSCKPAGRRRGLGLAKAQRWLQASGGLMKLESRPGRGTRAVVLLPAAGAAAAPEPARTVQRKAAM